jgi:hypothetical protein
MGSMTSPVRKIDNMDFKPIPEWLKTEGKIFKSNSTIVIMGKKGCLYTNCVPLNRKVHCSGVNTWAVEIFEALKSFGLLTKEEIDIHADYLSRKLEQDKISGMMYSIYCASDGSNPAISVNYGTWRELWNRLDYYNQKNQFKYRPPGAKLKRKPLIKY